ncbi:hypothetical protein M501DRAFT_929125 [Patellaria atrata CBS 101060]|uniref:Cap binding protein n=1 Tax=Patellaria atrata CBS 101060 TaxID=1346257 RepID=A0A9P4SFL3_9PEZI|nr:hypothetical protein M501DRAFT_929125 [Patellaria atrata CBS 101060]
MADVDSRANGRNRGHYNNRKRRQREDDSDDRPSQIRRRVEDQQHMRLRKQLLIFAQSALKDSKEEAKEVAGFISYHFNDSEQFKQTAFDVIYQLIIEQPFKIPFLASIVLHINERKGEVAAQFITRAAVNFTTALEKGAWRDCKLHLRFLACLQPFFEGEGVFSVLDELFNRAVDLQTASSDDTLGLELVKIILLTIPYVLAQPGTDLAAKAAELLEKTDIVASAGHDVEALVNPYPGSTGEKPFEYQSMLGLLQAQLQAEASKGWELAVIPRVYWATTPDAEASSSTSTAPQKHAFPTITVPASLSQGDEPIFPAAYFSLYTKQDIETVPPTSDIASCLLRDVLVDTINVLDFNRVAAAKFLIELDNYWTPDTFVKRATQFDKVKEIAGTGSTWKPEDLALDAVFSQLFRLPTAEHKLVYYHSLITEACKLAPAAIAPSLGRAIRFIFRHLETMDIELINRFMDWFAHHLSNFEFRWKWSEWSEDILRSNLHPKKVYIMGSLDKEIRLSFAKRIRETLPPEYHHLISVSKEKDTPDFKYADDATPYATEGRQLLSLLRKKATDEEIQEVIASIQTQAAEHGVTDVLIPSTDAYITCLCFIGSKSLSHVLSNIDRSKDRLLAIGPSSEAARRQIIGSVVDYWTDHPGTAVNLVDKLLNYTILTPMSIIQWAVGDRLGTGSILAENWLYDMVGGTVRKVTNRVRQIVAARLENDLPHDQMQMLEETLVRERDAQRELFSVIDDAMNGVAQGVNDGAMEAIASGDLSQEDGMLIRVWGEKWKTAFARKAAVEETIVGESAVMEKIAARKAKLQGILVDIENGDENNGTAEPMDEIDTSGLGASLLD